MIEAFTVGTGAVGVLVIVVLVLGAIWLVRHL